MGFGNLKTPAGLNALNAFLADRSYIEGYVPSQADIVVYDSVGKAPAADVPHALRWYKNITSYQNQKSSLPGVKKSLDSYGPSGDSAAADEDNDDDDDDFDMFDSDDEEAEALKKKRLEEYAAKKAKKPAVIAKSSIILDVKPWEDTTDMKEMEKCVRSIVKDGLLWGASKLVPVGYGVNKLQITCVIEDEKISVDELEEDITAFEDYVQSVDIAAFNKI